MSDTLDIRDIGSFDEVFEEEFFFHRVTKQLQNVIWVLYGKNRTDNVTNKVLHAY